MEKIMRLTQRKPTLDEKQVFISCIIPIYNEADNIEPFFKKLWGHLRGLAQRFEIIVVDDGSKDMTISHLLSLPKEYEVKIISFSRNFGKEIALTAGLEHCRGDVAILMDADFQHPIEVLPSFVKHWGEGYDMVSGLRNNRQTESAIKRNLAYLFSAIVRHAINVTFRIIRLVIDCRWDAIILDR